MQASPNAAQTTIYYVQTITALMTSTTVQTSIMTFCPSAFSSYVPSAYPGLGNAGSSGGSGTGTDGSEAGPCPGQGYTCSDCLDGWFCPPFQTPAAQVPCGYGWPCYHCEGGFFCVPIPQTVAPAAPVHAHSTPTPQTALPADPQPTNGYQYVGCYEDNPNRSLRDAQLLSVAGGMTTGQCVDFCQTQGFAIAGTEDGTQCFCGTLLLDSVTLDEGHCNMSCSGDVANSSMCGGPWALSIWTIDGSVQQAQDQSPEKRVTLATAPGWQDALAVKSKFDAATAVYAWPPLGPSISTGAGSLTSMNTSKLESAILAAVAAEASGLAPIEPASASDIIASVSMILNMGMSSIASDLSLVGPISNTILFSGPTNIPLAPGPVIPLTNFPPLATTFPVMVTAITSTTISIGSSSTGNGPSVGPDSSGSEGVSADAADDEGSYIFPSLPGVASDGKGLRLRAGLM